MLTGRVDDKGRLKLPADMIEYFRRLPEKTLFVTSLDGIMGQLYRKSVWQANERFFQSYKDKPKVTKDVAFLAAAMGAATDMDPQGRVQLPAKLRKQLGLEEGVVHLYAYKGRIQILSEAVFQQKFGAALQGSEDKVDELDAEGLQ
jgi:MraZ protein